MIKSCRRAGTSDNISRSDFVNMDTIDSSGPAGPEKGGINEKESGKRAHRAD